MAKKKLTVKELEATRKGINKDEEDEKKAKAQGVRTSAPVYTYKDTNVTASDVAKKFNVQLPNKHASTGSTTAPGVPPVSLDKIGLNFPFPSGIMSSRNAGFVYR